MAVVPQGHLFSWRDVDAASDLDRLRLVLQAIPDEGLMERLEERRGRGRNEYPVRAMWNSVLAGVVYQHPTVETLRRELKRNEGLRELCRFEPFGGEEAVPTASAYSNFLEGLLDCEEEIPAMFDELIERLREHLPDLGEHLAVDGKAVASYGKKAKKAEKGDRRGEHDADWGVKTYRGKREDGSSWEKVVRWFGFELHLLVDSVHEIPLGYEVTKASAAETKRLLALVEACRVQHPGIIKRAEDLAADRGYDSERNNRELYDEYGIRPIIDKRADWKEEPTRPVFEERADTVVYDVKGQVSCVCPATGTERAMVGWGFEKERGTLKYRCPTAVYGIECEGRDRCPGAQSEYGKVARIPIEEDRRMFTPVARDSLAWKRAYKRRTAVERVNGRLDQVLGFEQHTIRGRKKMQVRVGIALVVLLAMALGRIEAGQREKMRSLLAPVRRAAA